MWIVMSIGDGGIIPCHRVVVEEMDIEVAEMEDNGTSLGLFIIERGGLDIFCFVVVIAIGNMR